MNESYNFQDTIILRQTFKSRASLMEKEIAFNPRRSNSARTLSRCIQRNLSKVVLALPIDSETDELFEKL